MIKSTADGKIQDTGPMTRKRMETADEEFLAAGLDFLDRAKQVNKPFFMWFNSPRMHVWTHLKKESDGKTGIGLYPDGIVEHDGHVGQLLKKLDDLGIRDNTIIMYSTDNGAELVTWPDGGTTPFHGEKGTTWEGGHRVPLLVKWLGVIKPGAEINDMIAHNDWMPPLESPRSRTSCCRAIRPMAKPSRSTSMATTTCPSSRERRRRRRGRSTSSLTRAAT